ncbi:MAG: hypothetical protein ACYTEL_12540 [Planctomycetota bacterium]|jgi:hypothetical protein
MAKSRSWQILTVATVSVLSFGPRSLTGAELLDAVPAESLFCVKINNLDYTLNQLDQFLAGVSPMPLGLSMLARAQMAQLLGSPELAGVNMGGSFAVFAKAAGGESTQAATAPKLFIAALVPVTDYARFVTGNPNVGEPDDQGISKITSQAVTRLLAASMGDYALITKPDDYDKLVEHKKLMAAETAAAGRPQHLKSVLEAAEAEQAAKKPIWAYGNIRLVSETFGDLISGQIEQTKKMLETVPAGLAGQGPVAAQIMDTYTSLFDKLADQTKSVSLAMTPSPEACRLTFGISAVPNSEMAQAFAGGGCQGQYQEMLGYLEDAAAVSFAGRIDSALWKKLNRMGMNILAGFAGSGISPQGRAQMDEIMDEFFDVLVGPAAFSTSIDAKHKPPLAVKYAMTVKDADTFNKVMQKTAAMMNSGPIADFYKSLGFETHYEITTATAVYKDVPIDSAKFKLKLVDPNSPQAMMMAAMYGDGLDYRWAVVDGLYVGAMGGDLDKTVRELIDQVKAGGPEQVPSEIKAALELLPEAKEACCMATFNVPRLFGFVLAMSPIPMPPVQIPTKSNIVVAAKCENDALSIHIALPKQHLTEIMGMFMMMQQQPHPTMPPPQPEATGINSIPIDETTWLKCRNTACKAEFEIPLRQYYQDLETRMREKPDTIMVPVLTCKKCGEQSAYKAARCAKCGLVFAVGWKRGDFEDRCPDPACAYSQIEADRKRAAQARQRPTPGSSTPPPAR